MNKLREWISEPEESTWFLVLVPIAAVVYLYVTLFGGR